MPKEAVVTNTGSINSQGLCNSLFENSFYDNGTLRTTPQNILSST